MSKTSGFDQKSPESARYRVAKRLMDIGFSAVGLLLLSPIFLAIVITLLVVHGRPVFFRQLRPGYHGKTFEMIKFRTMTSEKCEMGELLPDSSRLTPLGKFLRETSLDELPELINVLRGDMSLVGPRPLLQEYLERYTPEQFRRHAVRPGITGWAQIHGRNDIDWADRFKLDLWYIDNRSLVLDLKILLLTMKKVIRREGITKPGHATMEVFRGDKE